MSHILGPTAPFTGPIPVYKFSSRRAMPVPRSQPPEVELEIPLKELTSSSVIFAVAGSPGHDRLGHAECAARVPAILEALETHRINQNPRVIQLPEWYLASPEEIAPVHNAKYISALERTSENARDVANVIVDPAPTYVTQTTYRDTLNAAGAAMSLVDHVVAASLQQKNNKEGNAGLGEVPVGFSICRPPGHHAVPTNGMGFCLLNNAAIAAKHAQQVHGLKKIAIYDFDVHHGNGTEDVFTSDPSVLFISTHQSGSYPNTGKAEFVGKDDGEGASINIPLPGDAGHSAALAAFDEIVGPAIKRFNPDMIICSAGYDAHWDEHLAGLQFRSGTYHTLATKIKALAQEIESCGGRVVFLLEGGYNLRALGESVASTFNGILGNTVIDSIDPSVLRDEPAEKVKSALLESRRIHGL